MKSISREPLQSIPGSPARLVGKSTLHSWRKTRTRKSSLWHGTSASLWVTACKMHLPRKRKKRHLVPKCWKVDNKWRIFNYLNALAQKVVSLYLPSIRRLQIIRAWKWHPSSAAGSSNFGYFPCYYCLLHIPLLVLFEINLMALCRNGLPTESERLPAKMDWVPTERHWFGTNGEML